jgi:hypothetical protein
MVRHARRAPGGSRLSRRESMSVPGVVLITRTGVLVGHRGSPWWWWSCGGVGVGAGRVFGPPIGFRGLAAVAELADVGAFASVWLLVQSASLLGGWRTGGLAVCAGRRVVMVRRAAAVGGLARRRRGRQVDNREHAAAGPPVRTATGMNRRWRDHIQAVGLDHLAGADQVTGPGLTPVREPVALQAGAARRDADGLPAGAKAT